MTKVTKKTKRNIRAKATTKGFVLTVPGALSKKMIATPNGEKYAINVLKAAFGFC